MSYPTYELEDVALSNGYSYICGVDEVGRGALSSVVVAAAVVIPTESMPLLIGKVNDSKKLSHKKRVELSELIKETCEYSIGEVDNAYIDQYNILVATKFPSNLDSSLKIDALLNSSSKKSFILFLSRMVILFLSSNYISILS